MACPACTRDAFGSEALGKLPPLWADRSEHFTVIHAPSRQRTEERSMTASLPWRKGAPERQHAQLLQQAYNAEPDDSPEIARMKVRRRQGLHLVDPLLSRQ